jgi:hypothetical protein
LVGPQRPSSYSLSLPSNTVTTSSSIHTATKNHTEDIQNVKENGNDDNQRPTSKVIVGPQRPPPPSSYAPE